MCGVAAGARLGRADMLFVVHRASPSLIRFHSLQAGNASVRSPVPRSRQRRHGRRVEEQGLAIAAFTVERWNGLVIRKVGSGRSPVSSRSGKAVMKITGTENSARMSLTASMPELSSASWMSASTRPGRFASAWRDRLVAGDGDAGDVVAEIADDRLDVHGDDRLVLDDQHVGAGLPLDLGQRLGDQALDLVGRGVDQIAGILGREALHRGQQQRLARQRRDPRRAARGRYPRARRSSAWPGSSSTLADDQMAWKVR